MFTRCPKCGHAPLPDKQALPAACPACGVILAKVRQPAPRPARVAGATGNDVREEARDSDNWTARLLQVPERVDAFSFWLRAALLGVFAVWGVVLIAQDVRNGEMAGAFLHRPLLVFHEAGHVVFMAFGHLPMVLGGTLGQLIMPLLMALALLLKNRDPFGAAIGLWFLGVSLLDVAPYVYDAKEPQLMLLSGLTGEAGGHDWIELLSRWGLLHRAQGLGLLTHKAGALVVLVALLWAIWVLRLQWANVARDVLRE